jgi:hypothetical protein
MKSEPGVDIRMSDNPQAAAHFSRATTKQEKLANAGFKI